MVSQAKATTSRRASANLDGITNANGGIGARIRAGERFFCSIETASINIPEGVDSRVNCLLYTSDAADE